jgi:hypothetical protein
MWCSVGDFSRFGIEAFFDLAVMSLVGHDSPVVGNAHDESRSNLLGPHGSESRHVFASAKNASRFEQWQSVESTRQNCEPDISSNESHTPDENNIQTESCGRHRTHFNHQRSQRYSESISVSYVVSRFAHRSCQPRLIFPFEAIHSHGYNSNPLYCACFHEVQKSKTHTSLIFEFLSITRSSKLLLFNYSRFKVGSGTIWGRCDQQIFGLLKSPLHLHLHTTHTTTYLQPTKPTTPADSLAHSIHTLLNHHTAAGTTLRWQAFRSLRSSWLYAFSSSSLPLQLQHQHQHRFLKLEAPLRRARIGFHRSQDKEQFLSALQDTKSSEMSRTSVPQVTDLRMTQLQSMLRSLLDHVADKVVTRQRLRQP